MSKKVDWKAVQDAMSKVGQRGNSNRDVDTNLYLPKLKDDGTYDAIIRFLPSPDTDLPYAIVYNHGYQSLETGKWVIENCPKSLDKKCPICESASRLWSSGDEENARRRFKKFSAYSNILVVRDPQNPENEGKVFIYRYGKKLFEMIKNKMIPPSTLDEPLMVFDYDEGANFKLKIRSKIINDAKGNKKPVPNYDSSEFTAPSALSEQLVTEIESLLIPLTPYLAPEKFLSYSELERKITIADGGSVRDSEDERSDIAQSRRKSEEVTDKATHAVDDADDFFANLKRG